MRWSDMLAWTLFIVSVLEVSAARANNSADARTRLRAKLLYPAVYDHVARPSDTTHVKVGLNLLTINDLDMKSQKFSCSGWLTLKWNDSRLKWDPAEHGNESYIYALESEIWKPEIIVSNSMKNIRVLGGSDILLRIKHSGVVIWEPPIIFETHCDVDVTYYPFDSQRCHVELVSWSAPISDQFLCHMYPYIIMDDYRANGEWVFIGSSTEKRSLVEHHDTIVHVYSQLEFYITVRRRPRFYIINTMMPMILTTFLTVLVFLLPSESGEKVSYALTVILALAVLLTVIADHLPSTSLSVPVLAVYMDTTLCLGSIAVFFTVLILRTYHRPPDIKPSAWTMKLTLLAYRMILFKPSSVSQKLRKIQSSRKTNKGNNEQTVDSPESSVMSDLALTKSQSQVKLIRQTNSDPYETLAGSPDSSVVFELAHLDNRKQKPTGIGDQTKADAPNQLQLTWIDIAIIWDRFCFHVFTLVCVVSTVAFVSLLYIGGYYYSHGQRSVGQK